MYFGDSPLWLGRPRQRRCACPPMIWFHAEGATGSLFDTFILLANPNAQRRVRHVTFITDTRRHRSLG